MAVNHILQTSTERIKAIWQQIEDAEGETTDELWDELQALLVESESAIVEAGCRVKEKEEAAKAINATVRKWMEAGYAQSRAMNQLAGKTREVIRKAFKATKSRKAVEGPVCVYLRANNKGTIECSDPALDKTKSVDGYTFDQIQASQVPMHLFKPVVVYVLNKDAIRSCEANEEDTGSVKITHEPTVAIKIGKESTLEDSKAPKNGTPGDVP